MGKFGKEHFSEGNEWRVDIKVQLNNLSESYISCINPNDYYNFLDDSTYDSQKEVMDFDLWKLRQSDLLIINFNDISSLGTMTEIAIAYELRIPVIGLCEDNNMDQLHPWQKSMCLKIFTDREDLVRYVIDYIWT